MGDLWMFLVGDIIGALSATLYILRKYEVRKKDPYTWACQACSFTAGSNDAATMAIVSLNHRCEDNPMLGGPNG